MRAEKMTESVAPKTLGEIRVRVDFNPNNNDVVHKIKTKMAEIIDELRASLPDEDLNKTNLERLDPEGQLFVEKCRLVTVAQERVEEACMWTVKALTAQYK